MLTVVWAIAALELALQLGIVVNAYRLTKLTGSFRAWTMIILAFVLSTVSSVLGVVFLLSNPDQLVSLLQSFNIVTIIFSYGISISTSLLLFLGISELVRRFKQAANKP